MAGEKDTAAYLSKLVPSNLQTVQRPGIYPRNRWWRRQFQNVLPGKTVDLNTIVGNEPIMLVFWSTWCDDCKEKLPEINEMVKKYSDNGLRFIGIN